MAATWYWLLQSQRRLSQRWWDGWRGREEDEDEEKRQQAVDARRAARGPVRPALQFIRSVPDNKADRGKPSQLGP